MKSVIAIFVIFFSLSAFAQNIPQDGDSKFALCKEIGMVGIMARERGLAGEVLGVTTKFHTSSNPFVNDMLRKVTIYGLAFAKGQSAEEVAAYGQRMCLSHPMWQR